MTRWEYTTLQVVAGGFEDEDEAANYQSILNQYGAQGWELVSSTCYPGRVVEGTVMVLFFKRPLPE